MLKISVNDLTNRFRDALKELEEYQGGDSLVFRCDLDLGLRLNGVTQKISKEVRKDIE